MACTKNLRLSSSSWDDEIESINKFFQWFLDKSRDGTAEIKINAELLISSYTNLTDAIAPSTLVALLDNLNNSACTLLIV